jgi:Xaa-Pro dipeptidase
MKQKLQVIQVDLQKQQIDGWLFYDFRHSNDLACNFLGISSEQMLTRRFYYWIPAIGEPLKIVSAIENPLKKLPGKTLIFSGWQQMEEHLKTAFKGARRVAMEYSPRNAIPYISKVDAGTIEMVRDLGVEVVSSCDLLQKFTSLWTDEQLAMHLEAADVLDRTAAKTWAMIFGKINNDEKITEYEVQQFILSEFKLNGCVTSDAPICAVNAHSADPHYSPDENRCSRIKSGDFILIDLWCKLNKPNAVFADITRVGVAAKKPTEKQQEIFSIVKAAQENATELVRARFAANQPLQGWEVDKTARDVITAAGYGEYFVHRTGHNIDIADHGNGAHIDNLETQDQRFLLKQTCFSIEPGIYLPGEFGVRLEYDLYITKAGEVLVTGGTQNELETMKN